MPEWDDDAPAQMMRMMAKTTGTFALGYGVGSDKPGKRKACCTSARR